MHFKTMISTIICVLLMAGPSHAAVQIVASLPGLGDIAKQVGGTHAVVTVLAGPTQNPHFVDAKPSYALALHRADLVIYNGLDLEVGWLPPLLENARNPGLRAGQVGHFDASQTISMIMDISDGAVDRRMGDVHAAGNPHYLYDPNNAIAVAMQLAVRLGRIDPDRAAAYRANAERFATSLATQITRWEQRLSAYQGRRVIGYHKSLSYLTAWLGLQVAGHIEPLPGVKPSARHLAQLILHMRSTGAQVIVAEPWYDNDVIQVVAQKAEATFVRFPGDVGANDIQTYVQWMDAVIGRLEAAWKNQEYNHE